MLDWMYLRVDGSEIQGLSTMATEPTLRLVEEINTGPSPSDSPQAIDLDTSNLEVELTRVAIMRPWLEPLIFRSRAWKWPRRMEPLSDGLEPPGGSLPAYTTEVVLARNLDIELKQNPEKNEWVTDELRAGRSALVGPLPLTSVFSSDGPQGVQTERLQSAGTQIIAFVCQKVPKSPDPDPTFDW